MGKLLGRDTIMGKAKQISHLLEEKALRVRSVMSG